MCREKHILSEPAARNTAPACALAAFLLERDVAGDGDWECFRQTTWSAMWRAFAEVMSRGCGAGATQRGDRGAGGSADAAGDGLRVYRAGRSDRSDLWRAASRSRCDGCSGLRRSRTRRRRSSFCAPATMRGTAGCFCGARRRWPMRCGSISPTMAPLLEQIAAAWGTPKFDKRLCGGLSAVRDHLHRLCGAGAAVGEGRGEERRCIACREILRGMILVRGQRCMSMWPSARSRTTANVVEASACIVEIDRRETMSSAPGKTVALVGVKRPGGGARRTMRF